MGKIDLQNKVIVFIGDSGVGKSVVSGKIEAILGLERISTDVYFHKYYDNDAYNLSSETVYKELCELINCGEHQIIDIGAYTLSSLTNIRFKKLKALLKEKAFLIYLKPTEDAMFNAKFLARIVQLKRDSVSTSVVVKKLNNRAESMYNEIADCTIYTVAENPQDVPDVDKYYSSYVYYQHLLNNVSKDVLQQISNNFTTDCGV